MEKITYQQYFLNHQKEAGTAQALILAVPVKAGENMKLKGHSWAFIGDGPAPSDGWQIVDPYYPQTSEPAYRFMTNEAFEKEYTILTEKKSARPDSGKISIFNKSSLTPIFEMSSDMAIFKKDLIYAVSKKVYQYLAVNETQIFAYRADGTGTLNVSGGTIICYSPGDEGSWCLASPGDHFNKSFRVIKPPGSTPKNTALKI